MTGRNYVTDRGVPFRRLGSMLATLVLMVGLVTAGFGGGASATTTTYGFWNLDGCHYTWAGPAETWRKGTCGPKEHVQWGRDVGAHQLFHWDGVRWTFQGIYGPADSMDTPSGIFVVPFVSERVDHLFIYDYARKAWHHISVTRQQSVAAVSNPNPPPPVEELETSSGWRSLEEVGDPALGSMLRQWADLQGQIIAT